MIGLLSCWDSGLSEVWSIWDVVKLKFLFGFSLAIFWSGQGSDGPCFDGTGIHFDLVQRFKELFR